jgi:hypothetical protein
VSERGTYDEYMDGLALRIGAALEGVKMADAVSVCAAIIGYSLAEISKDDERERVLQSTIAFIRTLSDDRGDLE